MSEISERLANEKDLILYFNWANDSLVRENAINKQEIKLAHHEKWFLDRISRANTVMFVYEIDNSPIGQVRFDIENRKAIIDYSVDQMYRGQGNGSKILKMAIETLQDYYKGLFDEVNGVVKEENLSSCKIFKSLGFDKKPDQEIHGVSFQVFSLKAN